MCSASPVSCVVYGGLLAVMWLATHIEARTSQPRASQPRIPDEQRLYRDLMYGYESSVRPVLNASKIMVIDFRLSLNQIVDLDERKQVLTTNVFIDQEWQDDKLKWDPSDYNGIRTMRVPADLVWLPDTFVFNNADDGATGFMQGVYVVLDHNGTVLWPVPVKLKSSCKVDITYFPFDAQQCVLRFGSWIYSGEWMDFESSIESVDMEYYMDNSEWELVAIQFEKTIRRYACCPDPHPDLTYVIHIQRRTFYYIFNIIVPCIMLSILTLLTFWLPTTSGEKISLGLSVFLAFSMFMLLIAEEVPATSESVPLIGVYLTTVMTMTSVSVIMSVMVINLYNRGYRAHPSPKWLKVLVLDWLCRLLRMKHDIEQLATTIRLEEQEEMKYACDIHGVYPRHRSAFRSPRQSIVSSLLHSAKASPDASPHLHTTPVHQRVSPEKDTESSYGSTLHPNSTPHQRRVPSGNGEVQQSSTFGSRLHPNYTSADLHQVSHNGDVAIVQKDGELLQYSQLEHSQGTSEEDEDEEPVWRKRDTLIKAQREELAKRRHELNARSKNVSNDTFTGRSRMKSSKIDSHVNSTYVNNNRVDNTPVINLDDGLESVAEDLKGGKNTAEPCNRKKALRSRREIVVEWQTMAMVIDRLLFWIFLIATVVAYIVILLIIPYINKPKFPDDMLPMRVMRKS